MGRILYSLPGAGGSHGCHESELQNAGRSQASSLNRPNKNRPILLLLKGAPRLIFAESTNSMSLHEDIQTVSEDLGPACRVRLTGRITIDSSPSLRALLLERLKSEPCLNLILDLSGVSYVDTSGLAIFVETLKAARTQGKAFHLTGLTERPRYLLEATRLLRLFDATPAEPPVAKSAEESSL
jgi:anti-sigma B factor antagonist